jgi:hypothetical protein
LWDYTHVQRGESGIDAVRERLLDECVTPTTYDFPIGGRLDVINVGRRDQRFRSRSRYFSWRVFCDRLDGERVLDHAFAGFRANYDYILVDLASAPRPEEESAYVLKQACDAAVLPYSHGDYVLSATAEVARAVTEKHRSGVHCLPVPARVQQAELDLQLAAEQRAREVLGPYLQPTDPDWPRAFNLPELPFFEMSPPGLYFGWEYPWPTIASRVARFNVPGIPVDEGRRLVAIRKAHTNTARTVVPALPPQPFAGASGYAFLTYSRAELDRLLEIAENLEALGVPAWWDAGIPGGSEWTEELSSRIASCHFVVFLASRASMSSEYVRQEIQWATAAAKPILTLRLDATPMPDELSLAVGQRQALDVWHADFDAYLSRALDFLRFPDTPTAQQAD